MPSFRTHGEHTPTGISGDFTGETTSSPAPTDKISAIALQNAMDEELIQRVESGTATDTEVQSLMARLNARAAQDYS